MKLQTLKSSLQQLRPVLPVIQSSSWRAGKESSTQRGYGYKWQKARAAYLVKHPLCVYCEREGRVTEATVVDHIVPHRGDMKIFWDSAGWQGLCATHHSGDKQREEAAEQRYAKPDANVIDDPTLVRPVAEKRFIRD